MCVCIYCVTVMRLVSADKTLVFAGNRTSPDHFHELLLDGDYLIVGARYVMRRTASSGPVEKLRT